MNPDNILGVVLMLFMLSGCESVSTGGIMTEFFWWNNWMDGGSNLRDRETRKFQGFQGLREEGQMNLGH